MANEQKKAKWSLEADYIQGCNCDFGCPCEFSAPPTQGYCEGMGAWRITKGNFDGISLDGLGMAFAAHWPKAIHEGNGTACLFFDERANAAQRDALLRIATGQEGGLPFEIIATTFSKVLEPRYVPIKFQFNGANSRVDVGKEISESTMKIKNPVTGEPESVTIDHGTGFIFQKAEALANEECRVDVEELKFNWPQKAAFITRVKYGN